jgi:hypothetical protein
MKLPSALGGFGGGTSVSVLSGEDSVRCSQGMIRVQRAAGGGGDNGSRITAREDRQRRRWPVLPSGGRADLESGDCPTTGGAERLARWGGRSSQGEQRFSKKRRAETTESKIAGANAEEAFRDELREQQKNTP